MTGLHKTYTEEQKREKAKGKNILIINPLFDGLVRNTGRYFTRCSHFSSPRGENYEQLVKYRPVLRAKPSNKVYIYI